MTFYPNLLAPLPRVQELIRHVMQDVSPALQAFSLSASLAQLRALMARLAITHDQITRYVVAPQHQQQQQQQHQLHQHQQLQQAAGADEAEAAPAPAAVPAAALPVTATVQLAAVAEPMEVEEESAAAAQLATQLATQLNAARGQVSSTYNYHYYSSFDMA